MIYKIYMSKGDNITIDDEDLQHIQDNLSAPLIRVKQAIINPSFMVSIYPTGENEFEKKKKVEMINGKPTLIEEGTKSVVKNLMSEKKKLSEKFTT